MAEKTPSRRKDLFQGRMNSLLLWGVPIAVFIAGKFTGPDLRTWLWIGSLTQMTLACFVNAWRCGRMHCFFTGSWFLIGAVATAAYRAGLLPLGPEGWNWIGYSVLIGGITLRYVPEQLWGTYARG